MGRRARTEDSGPMDGAALPTSIARRPSAARLPPSSSPRLSSDIKIVGSFHQHFKIGMDTRDGLLMNVHTKDVDCVHVCHIFADAYCIASLCISILVEWRRIFECVRYV